MSNMLERAADYLEDNRGKLLNNWLKKVIVDADDPYRNAVHFNGDSMLNLVIRCLRDDCVNEDTMQALAYRVSFERLQSNVNIGDFVYNVNVGRSEILDCLPKTGVSLAEMHLVLHTVDTLFNKFLHLAVHHYTDMKHQQLVEQSLFIEQSHKDKMTILGQMSSSFVHEFRNPLTSLIGFVQLLKDKYPDLEYIDIMDKELDSLNFRINQFLHVSKKGNVREQRVQFKLSRIVEETLDFLYPITVNDNVVIEQDLDPSIFIWGYPEEFKQVLINIIMNSLDALSSTSSKQIHLKGWNDTETVVLEISNNGPPIPDALLTVIFEPFVSSKDLGTGIGLYVCQKIIRNHQGFIECESNPEWTTFRITVPLFPSMQTW